MQVLLALEHMHAVSEYFVSYLCRSISHGNLAYSTTMYDPMSCTAVYDMGRAHRKTFIFTRGDSNARW